MSKGLTGIAGGIYFLVARLGALAIEILILAALVTRGQIGWAVVFFFVGSPFVLGLMHLVGLAVALPFAAGAIVQRKGEPARTLKDISGPIIAKSSGKLDGVLKSEIGISVNVELGTKALLIHTPSGIRCFDYEHITHVRFRDDDGSNPGQPAVAMSLNEADQEGRWMLLIRPTDLKPWQDVFADATEG